MKKKTTHISLLSKLFWLSAGSVLYTYFGYPLLVALLAKRKPKREYDAVDTLSVTLLIAAYNEERVIEEKIKNSLSLNYPKDYLQIMIVTDGSDDETPDVVKKYLNNGVELLHKPERLGKMAAINRALSYAKGEIIVFSDANNFYYPDTLKHLLTPFSDPEVGAVSGAKIIQEDDSSLSASEGLYWKYESFIKEQESRLSSCTGVAGEIFALRRKAYIKPPDVIINDDFFMAMQVVKQGYRLVYAPKARSIEKVSATSQDEITRRKRIVAGRYQAIFMAKDLLPIRFPILVWQIISHKFLRPLVPFSMILAAFTNLIAVFKNKDKGTSFWSLNSPFGKVILGLQIAFYSLAWVGAELEKGKKMGFLARITYLPSFLVNSNIAALQGFFQYVRGQQTTLWEKIPRRDIEDVTEIKS